MPTQKCIICNNKNARGKYDKCVSCGGGKDALLQDVLTVPKVKLTNALDAMEEKDAPIVSTG